MMIHVAASTNKLFVPRMHALLSGLAEAHATAIHYLSTFGPANLQLMGACIVADHMLKLSYAEVDNDVCVSRVSEGHFFVQSSTPCECSV